MMWHKPVVDRAMAKLFKAGSSRRVTMASISRLADGRKQIDYKPPGHSKQTMRLGIASDDAAHEFKKRINLLLAAKKLGEVPDLATLQWAKRIDRKFYKQLARVGLVRQREAYTVGELVAWFVSIKNNRRRVNTEAHPKDGDMLVSKAGKNAAIDDVTVQQANEFREWLLTKGGRYGRGLAEATVSRTVAPHCTEYFEAAVKERWLEKNPFAAIGNRCEVNEERDRYIPVEHIGRLINFSTRPRLSLMLALSRYGGLRGVAEFAALEWDWMNWTDNVLKVYALEDAPLRTALAWIPVSPELRVQF